MNYFTLKETVEKLNQIIENEQSNAHSVVPWIIVKVLRLKREEFDYVRNVNEEQFQRMEDALQRYIKGESLSDIFGFIEFYGRFFEVTKNVFDPRLSTECLISAVIQTSNYRENSKIIDLCTGTGCVAITLSKETGLQVDGVDISESAIELAKLNNEIQKANACFFEMDLLEDWNKVLKDKYDVIVSNPPYWTSEKILDKPDVVKSNPLEAFDGGENGLKFHKCIIKNATNFLKAGGKLFLEMEPDQEKVIREELEENNFTNIETFSDYRNIKRVISAELGNEQE